MASDATNVFAFEDDYSMGILGSTLHAHWAWAQSSTIREDIRYTPTSVFETFPWPAIDDVRQRELGGIGRDFYEQRSRICDERKIGLTRLHHEMEEGLHEGLRKLRRELDKTVIGAYGWPRSVADDAEDSNRRLLELNAAIAAGEIEYAGPRG